MWPCARRASWLPCAVVLFATISDVEVVFYCAAQEGGASIPKFSSPPTSSAPPSYRDQPRLTFTTDWHPDDGSANYAISASHIKTGSLLPRYDVKEAAYVRVPDFEGGLVFAIGGYSGIYNGVTTKIQVFDGARNTWLKNVNDIHTMPAGAAATHIGYDVDASHRLLYIVSGQDGPACGLATGVAYAWKWPAVCNSIDGCAAEDGRFVTLPSLPAGEERYNPYVFLVAKQDSPDQPLSHSLHVVGGMQSPKRLEPSTSHWRLDFDLVKDANTRSDGNKAAIPRPQGKWVALPQPSPPTGIHGTWFQNSGSLYILGFCDFDLVAIHGETNTGCNQMMFVNNLPTSHIPMEKIVKYKLRTQAWEVLPSPAPLQDACHITKLELTGDVLLFMGGVREVTVTSQGYLKRAAKMKEVKERTHLRQALDTRAGYSLTYPTEMSKAYPKEYRGFDVQVSEGQKDEIATLDLKKMVWGTIPFPHLHQPTRTAMAWVDEHMVLRLMRPTEWHQDRRSKPVGAAGVEAKAASELPRPLNFQSIQLAHIASAASSFANIKDPTSTNFEKCVLRHGCSSDGGIGDDSSCHSLNGFKRIYPEDQRYETLRSTWNKAARSYQKPNAVVVVKVEQDVVTAVQCAVSAGLKVCVRGGKHDYEGASVCGPGGITVDIRKLRKFKHDGSTKITSFGAGNTLGAVNVQLNGVGCLLPSGHCASVGLPGLTLAGGHGLFSRQFGLTSDRLVSMRYVDASGTIQIANSTHNIEMFWLARGGGAGGDAYPGVITEVSYKTVPDAEMFRLPPTVNQFGQRFKKKGMLWRDDFLIFNIPLDISNPDTRIDDVACFFYAWQMWGPESSNTRLTVEAWIVTGVAGSWKNNADPLAPRVYLHGMYHGYKSVFEGSVSKRFHKVMKQECPALAASGKIGKIEIEQRVTNYLSYARHLAGSPALTNDQMMGGESGYDTYPPYNHWKGRSLVAYKRVSKDFMRTIATFFFTGVYAAGKRRTYVELKPLGGVLSNAAVPGVYDVIPGVDVKHTDTSLAPDTAFGHRQALFWMLVNSFWTVNTPTEERNSICKASHALTADLHSQTGEPFKYMYAGYPDHSMFESDKEELSAYFGKNAARVHSLVKKHDPENRFTKLKELRARRAWVCADSES